MLYDMKLHLWPSHMIRWAQNISSFPVLIIFAVGDVMLSSCQKGKVNLSWNECFFLLFRLYFWALYFRMEEIKCKKTSESWGTVLTKLGLYAKSEQGKGPKDLTWFSQIVMCFLMSYTRTFASEQNVSMEISFR